MLARISEILLDTYKVKLFDTSDEMFVKTRGKVKKKDSIKVGDIVEISNVSGEHVITEIKKRKNDYIRPPVTNIDYMFIVIAGGIPKPDYLLLDKQIITAVCNKSVPVIVINKMDLEEADEISRYVRKVYEPLGYKVILTNTKGELLVNEIEFKDIPEDSLCAFSGNSGVGKSSIISKIKNDLLLETGSVSDKTGKGKHTTKAVTIYNIKNNDNKNIYFLDTPGFSSFEIYNITAKELKNYYPEFLKYTCDYDDCNHIKEQEKYCKIKSAVVNGEIDKTRYENYIKIYEELTLKEKGMYR